MTLRTLTDRVAEERWVFTVSSEQLLYRHAAAERIVSGVSPTATSQVQKWLDGFSVDGNGKKEKRTIYQSEYYYDYYNTA